MKWHCNNCNDESPTRYCPKCGSECVEVAAQCPVTSARTVAPVADPQPGRIQPETFSREPEGRRRAPVRKNAAERNVGAGFFQRLPRKPLLIIAGTLIILIAGLALVVMSHRRPPEVAAVSSTTDIVIEKAPNPKPEGKAVDPAATSPASKSKVAKKTPAPKPTPQPWKYTVPPTQPAPKPQAQAARNQGSNGNNVLGKFFQVFEGPAPDVTPPSSDPRHMGQ